MKLSKLLLTGVAAATIFTASNAYANYRYDIQFHADNQTGMNLRCSVYYYPVNWGFEKPYKSYNYTLRPGERFVNIPEHLTGGWYRFICFSKNNGRNYFNGASFDFRASGKWEKDIDIYADPLYTTRYADPDPYYRSQGGDNYIFINNYNDFRGSRIVSGAAPSAMHDDDDDMAPAAVTPPVVGSAAPKKPANKDGVEQVQIKDSPSSKLKKLKK